MARAVTEALPMPVRRRSVLAAGTAGLLGAGLAGCSDDGSPRAALPRPSPGPTPDDLAASRARTVAAALAAAAERLATSRPDLAALLDAVVADHRAHLTALGAPAASGTSSSAVPSPSAAPSPSRSTAPTVAGLADRERSAAQAALDDVPAVSPGLATLLARIAASRAVHADLLAARAGLRAPGALLTSRRTAVEGAGSTPAQPPGPLPVAVPTVSLAPAARDALVALTAGEHAAVFAYGAVVARVAEPDRERARQAWSWHVARRDVLEERLMVAGLQPPAAVPAYDLGPLASGRAAGTLAATVEDRIAALTAPVVGTTAGADRSDAAEALVAGARRAAGWRGHGEALPG
jgi:Domain of unknown function (DUF4439)